MKFLHCADLHIDSPLRGLASYEGAPTEEIRGATRRAFENLIDLAVDEQVSCVVIAGDLYDGNRDDFNTAMFLQRHFARLRDEGIAVAIVYGNHDAENEITKRLTPPDNVHVFRSAEPETFLPPDTGLALHGQSYGTKVVDHDLSAAYPPPIEGLVNIGVLHTSLEGREGPHARYAPCTEPRLADRGYQYWALGHIHERYQAQRSDTWIVYPGNVQGRHVRETGPKGATLVGYEGDHVTSVEHRVLDVVRWARCPVDLTGAERADELTGKAMAALHAEADDAGGRLLAARLELRGETDAAAELLAGRETWEAQLRADAAGADGRIWIEKISVEVRPPRRDDGEELSQAIGAIQAAVAAAATDPALRAELADALGELRAKLGPDLVALAELELPTLDGDGVAALLPAVEAEILATITGSPS